MSSFYLSLAWTEVYISRGFPPLHRPSTKSKSLAFSCNHLNHSISVHLLRPNLSIQISSIITMKLFAVSLSVLLATAGMAAAAPADAADHVAPDIVEIFPRSESEIQKRGYGCGVFSHDAGVCNFHVRSVRPQSPSLLFLCIATRISRKLTGLQCINDVTKNCGGGHVIRPYKGVCGGFAGA